MGGQAAMVATAQLPKPVMPNQQELSGQRGQMVATVDVIIVVFRTLEQRSFDVGFKN
jgi:hypothetical protein